ncbi:MAG: hypothetical protein ACRDBO_02585 [Lachnospiraceae bacterium]
MNTNNNPNHHLHVHDPEKARYEQHRHFAGELYLSDFQTGQPDGGITRRIVRAEAFDEICRINDQLRQLRRDFL